MKDRIKYLYGVARVDPPRQELINLTESMSDYGFERYGGLDQELIDLIQSMRNCFKEAEGHFERSRWNRLVEIYYYLRYGLVGDAWIKINDLRDDLRWRIPANVYHTLEDLCEDQTRG